MALPLPVATGRRVGRDAPVYTYRRVAGVPPVGMLRAHSGALDPDGFARPHPHAHDFLVLVCVERGDGTFRVDDREWSLATGDVYVVAPGEVVAPGDGLQHADAWAVFFPPDVVEDGGPGAFLSWRAHPLLFPFVRGVAGGAQRLRVPPDARAGFSERLAALERELRERRDGYDEAASRRVTTVPSP